MSQVFIAVGSNIAPEANVRSALLRLSRHVHICAISTFFQTEPQERPEQPPYLNGVVEAETAMSPQELKFNVLRHIETELGRQRNDDRYAARPIDLDLILYNDLVINTEQLTLPDPDIPQRAFLAIPIHELAPELILPGTREPIRHVAERLSTATMIPLPEYSAHLREEICHES
ncbi:MAG TPA: 2-amino-4-hydroxy-6-hydroxymethyldihydropteridine diphosphokinase [Armatimonadota bacterium]|nr:2-amino-4-hydroxy-6-hydroxymethyldihydropteridine diphosphokinase [Armatimonadota bacterium]